MLSIQILFGPGEVEAGCATSGCGYGATWLRCTGEIHDFAAALRSLMKVGGVLWLTTPDAGHFRVPKQFLEWKEVIPPEHLCFYNIESLRRLLGEYDIEILKAQWLWKPSLRILARRVA